MSAPDRNFQQTLRGVGLIPPPPPPREETQQSTEEAREDGSSMNIEESTAESSPVTTDKVEEPVKKEFDPESIKLPPMESDEERQKREDERAAIWARLVAESKESAAAAQNAKRKTNDFLEVEDEEEDPEESEKQPEPRRITVLNARGQEESVPVINNNEFYTRAFYTQFFRDVQAHELEEASRDPEAEEAEYKRKCEAEGKRYELPEIRAKRRKFESERLRKLLHERELKRAYQADRRKHRYNQRRARKIKRISEEGKKFYQSPLKDQIKHWEKQIRKGERVLATKDIERAKLTTVAQAEAFDEQIKLIERDIAYCKKQREDCLYKQDLEERRKNGTVEKNNKAPLDLPEVRTDEELRLDEVKNSLQAELAREVDAEHQRNRRQALGIKDEAADSVDPSTDYYYEGDIFSEEEDDGIVIESVY